MRHEKATELFGMKKRQEKAAAQKQAREAAFNAVKAGYAEKKGSLEKPLSDFYNLLVRSAKATKLSVDMECSSFQAFLDDFLWAVLAKGARGNGHVHILSINPASFDSVLDIDADDDDDDYDDRYTAAYQKWKTMLNKVVVTPVTKAVSTSPVLSKLIKIEFEINPDDNFFQAVILVTAAAYEMIAPQNAAESITYVSAKDIAMEAFGKKARIKQRQQRRMLNNQTASKVFKAYLSCKPELVGYLNQFIEGIWNKLEIFNEFGIKKGTKPRGADILDEVIDHGYCGGSEYIYAYDWINDFPVLNNDSSNSTGVWDKFADVFDKFSDCIATEIKNLNARLPFLELEYCMIDDMCYMSVWCKSNAENFFLDRFKGFDSFLAMEGDYDVKGSMAEDAKNGLKILKDLGIGAAFTLGFGFTSHPVCAAIAGTGTVVTFMSDLSRLKSNHSANLDWANPTAEEMASVEVFKKKYEPAMMREAEKLRRVMMTTLGSVGASDPEHGLPLQAAAPTMLFNEHIYSHFFVASAKIALSTIEKSKKKDYEVGREWVSRLGAFKDELDRNYKGILGCSYIITKTHVVYGITFEWVGKDGIILPNLR